MKELKLSSVNLFRGISMHTTEKEPLVSVINTHKPSIGTYLCPHHIVSILKHHPTLVFYFNGLQNRSIIEHVFSRVAPLPTLNILDMTLIPQYNEILCIVECKGSKDLVRYLATVTDHLPPTQLFTSFQNHEERTSFNKPAVYSTSKLFTIFVS
jgi:hypothetical protein